MANLNIKVDVDNEVKHLAQQYVDLNKRQPESKDNSFKFRIRTNAGTDINIPSEFVEVGLIIGTTALVANVVLGFIKVFMKK